MTSTLSLILKGSLKKIKKVVIFLYIIAIPFSNIYSMNNPFYKTYNTQFEIPPFSEIEEKHYMPAFLKGMEEHNSEINEIIQNPEKPTFDNVIIYQSSQFNDIEIALIEVLLLSKNNLILEIIFLILSLYISDNI